jgi:hypothetical protein
MALDWTGLCCTDEDLAVRAEADWPLLVARPALAAGRDGVVSASAPWILASASNDFEAQGVGPGCVACLYDLPESTAPYREQVFGVASASAGALTLQLLGGPAGAGMPPGQLDGLAAVRFRVATARGRIAAASIDLARDLALSDPDLVTLVDAEGLREACCCKVLCELYYDRARQVREAADAPLWAGKARALCARYKELVAELRGVASTGTDAESGGDGVATMGPMADTLDGGPGPLRPPGW